MVVYKQFANASYIELSRCYKQVELNLSVIVKDDSTIINGQKKVMAKTLVKTKEV